MMVLFFRKIHGFSEYRLTEFFNSFFALICEIILINSVFALIQGLFVLNSLFTKGGHTLDVDLSCVLNNCFEVSLRNLLPLEYQSPWF